MSSTKEQVALFLTKCEEFKSCKFIMATTKIKDLLKSIVNSSELYMLFKEVTTNFDYLTAKKKYLVTVSDGVLNKSYVVLPEVLGERLAFIFCLLVEFDSDSLNFNKFLQRYYPEDGSYYSSYHAFCDHMISNLMAIVAEVFADELLFSEESEVIKAEPVVETPTESGANAQLAQKISEISLIISQESQLLASYNISSEEKQAGAVILTGILNAVKNQNPEQMRALLSGYNYFAMYNNCVNDNLAFLIKSISDYIGIL